MANTAPSASRQTIVLVVLSYFAISISMVFINKSLMDRNTTFEAPLFVTWFQCVMTAAICWALGEVGRRVPADSWFRQFPVVVVKLDVMQRLLPLSLAFTGESLLDLLVPMRVALLILRCRTASRYRNGNI